MMLYSCRNTLTLIIRDFILISSLWYCTPVHAHIAETTSDTIYTDLHKFFLIII